jgi:peptidoglycan/LPS O-acetylase OafA/YrhL
MGESATQSAATPHVARSTPRRRWTYKPELDGLRALAVAAVVAFHYEHRFKGGYLGVTVFFVLSGYLITGLLTTEREGTGRIDLGAFYARRALRLYPALIVVVIGVLIVASITGHQEVTTAHLYRGAGASLLYLNDFEMAVHHSTDWLDATWSLGVEEQFYLVWPLFLILALRKLPMSAVAWTCLALACLAGVLDVVLRPVIGPNWVYFTPVGSAMPLLLGASLSFVRPRLPAWLAASAGLLLVAFVVIAPSPEAASAWHGPEQLAAIAAAIVIAYLARPGWRVMRARILIWFGRRSYGIYLIHTAVLYAAINAMPGVPKQVHNLVALPLSVALAALSYRYVETPFLRRKRSFSRAPQATPEAAAR